MNSSHLKLALTAALLAAFSSSVNAQQGGYYPPQPGAYQPQPGAYQQPPAVRPTTPGGAYSVPVTQPPSGGTYPAGAARPAERPPAIGEIIVEGNNGPVTLIKPPFPLPTETEQRATDAVLMTWQGFSTTVRTFETKFTRIRYIPSFEDANKLDRHDETGELRYESPDRGMFLVNDKMKKPAEKWLCDGKSIYEYKYMQNEIEKYPLPEKMQGKAITAGPLPFLFGATSEELKRRYYIRLVAPPANLVKPGQIWIEAAPKTQEDATEFLSAKMIISLQPEVRPVAITLYKVNNEQHVYVFSLADMKVNRAQFPLDSWMPTADEQRKMKVIVGER